MTLQITELEYPVGGITAASALLSEDDRTPRPLVLVFHGWEGRSDSQVKVAQRLVDRGYAALACDLFGKGIRGDIAGDNSALIAPLMQDRALLQKRLLETVSFARSLDVVDPQRIAAIGFCFGGLCALDLARSGADIRAVASFHGVLRRAAGLPVTVIQARVIVFHGWEDPMAPPDDVVALGHELTTAKADWQLHAYGATMHAFMAVGMNRPEAGLQYNARSAKRAWATLDRFLEESFATRS